MLLLLLLLRWAIIAGLVVLCRRALLRYGTGSPQAAGDAQEAGGRREAAAGSGCGSCGGRVGGQVGAAAARQGRDQVLGVVAARAEVRAEGGGAETATELQQRETKKVNKI